MSYVEKNSLFGDVERRSVDDLTGKISKIIHKPEIVKVESFSQSGLFYEVDIKNSTCSCPAFQTNKRIPCKHLNKAFGFNFEKQEIPLSLIKSLVQKAVRRREVEVAIRSSKLMMSMDLNQFLRRWLIIIIEDAILHPDIGFIAKILNSGKGFRDLSTQEKDVIINCVFQVAESEERDVWVTRDRPYLDNDGNDIVLRGKNSEYKVVSLPDNIKDMLFGIKYRCGIGGMRGDIVFMNNYYYLWVDRFVNLGWTFDDVCKFFKKSSLKFDDVCMLEKKDIIPEAADFHCTPLLRIMLKKEYFVDLLQKYYPNQILEDLKGIEGVAGSFLWRQMSCINLKRIYDGSQNMQAVWYSCDGGEKFDRKIDEYIFSVIKNEVYRIMNWYINKAVTLK